MTDNNWSVQASFIIRTRFKPAPNYTSILTLINFKNYIVIVTCSPTIR